MDMRKRETKKEKHGIREMTKYARNVGREITKIDV